ncbi:MFS transporter [Paracoccus sp. 1_MG-2023]|uniref:MFS transporter n=1 Tax=unclassified Paracoccus (in: a-proteobacteria) TaxID=2688777 RepID=UPI001C09F1AC|nr:MULTISPECIES: MFS transporter [unclassified Paracoccus (in: a-proteobacteria)]MBU2958800.1 MFS transporter [Paracoccus sp. C2R09]MDO6667793.1 MFS transporter [Paracoccus sp. 1_MG-2023]
MRASILSLSTLLIGFALMQMGNGLQGTLLAVRAGIEGFGALSTGLIMSGFFAGMSLGSLTAPRFINRVGHIRTFTALASLASAAALMHLTFVDPYVWIVVRALTGFAFAGLIIVTESWLNASVASSQRGRMLSVYGMAGMAAGALGQFLLNLGDPATFTLFVLVSITMSIALIPISLARVEGPRSEEEQEPPSLRRLWRLSPYGAVAAALVGASIGTFYGLAPLYAQQLGYSQSRIAALIAFFTIGGLLLQFPLGWLSDRVSRRGLGVTVALVCTVMMLAPVSYVAPSAPILLLGGFVIGGLVLPAQAIAVAHVHDRAPGSALLSVSGGLVLLQGIGAAFGPLMVGAIMDATGPRGLPLGLALLQGAIAVWGIIRMLVRTDPETSERYAARPLTPHPVEGDLR